MIPFQQALEIVVSKSAKLPAEVMSIKQALGYALAKPVVALEDHPLYDLSAVDGYAMRSVDIKEANKERPVELKVIAKIPAGNHHKVRLQPGTAALVMTGAILPEGSDVVVPMKYIRTDDERIKVNRLMDAGENIRYKGSELRKEDGVLEAGKNITPGTVAMLAALGYPSVHVHKKPRVAVVTTGDELVDISQPAVGGRVRDSNAFFLASALQKAGVESHMIERVPDEAKLLLYAVSKSIESADIIIVTGGVSVAEYNVMGPIFSQLGVEQHFLEIAVSPDKPVFFGTLGSKLVFGLPGNPVVVGLLFYELILPAILTMIGRRAVYLQRVTADLESTLIKRTGRLKFIRGYLSWIGDFWSVVPFMKQESHMVSTFAKANCIIVFPEDKERLEKGEKVEVHLLPWFYD
jgi:molybdopterin molybdotransferase